MATKNGVNTKAAPATPAWEHTCENNVDVKVAGDIMTITIDLARRGEISKTGKTFTVASTNGFLAVNSHPGVLLSLNVNKKKE